MNNIINFPKENTHKITAEQLEYVVSLGESFSRRCDYLEKQLDHIKSMSLWDRIFNWPY